MITLLVKGGRAQAEIAAGQMGITIVASMAYNGSSEAVLKCASSQIQGVMNWFHEAPLHPPFPIGTLLWYKQEAHKGEQYIPEV